MQQQPVMQQPVMQQPVMQQPVMQQPVMQQPVMQQPAADSRQQQATTAVGPVPMAVGKSVTGADPVDLTVIITTFRRPHLLRAQLQALSQSTVRPVEIMVWCNDQVAAPHDLEAESHYTFVRSKRNLGPWARFSLALETSTKYVLILDDDCVPNPEWIESCVRRLEEMESQGETAVICASGRIFQADDPSQFVEVTPANPSDEELIVDEGTHGWFFRHDLGALFNMFPRPPSPVGWGLHFAAALQPSSIFQIVLPSAGTNPPMFVGRDETSLSKGMPGYDVARRQAWDHYRQALGWQPLVMLSEDDEQQEGSVEQRDAAQESVQEPT